MRTGNHASGFGTASQSGVLNNPIQDITYEKSILANFQTLRSWKVNFRTEVCSKANEPRLASPCNGSEKSKQQSQVATSSQHVRVKNISNSLTYTVDSSCVCTSPLAVMTIVGLHDFVKVSISASFNSFFADHMHRRSGVDNKFSFLRFKS